MVISFAGHAFVSKPENVKKLVKESLENIIISSESFIFYLGGYGEFDEICARVCKDLKKNYDNIQTIYVTPYITLSEQEKIKQTEKYGIYDAVIYPPIENTPKKFSIIKRNEWMVKNSDLIIVYVNHNYGGAYKSLQAAKHMNKRIINICDFYKP